MRYDWGVGYSPRVADFTTKNGRNDELHKYNFEYTVCIYIYMYLYKNIARRCHKKMLPFYRLRYVFSYIEMVWYSKVGIGKWDPLRKSIGDAPIKHPFIYRGCLIGCFQKTLRFCRNLLGFSNGSTNKSGRFTPAERKRKTSDWKSVSRFDVLIPKLGGFEVKSVTDWRFCTPTGARNPGRKRCLRLSNRQNPWKDVSIWVK